MFDTKIDFTFKARYVLNVHETPASEDSTCNDIAPRESVRISCVQVVLNISEALSIDIKKNLQTPSSENRCVV